MGRNIGREIELLKKEMAEIKEKLMEQAAIAKDIAENPLKGFSFRENNKKADDNASKDIRIIKDIHSDKILDDKLEELCEQVKNKGTSGFVSHLGVFYSNEKQHSWINSGVNVDDLLNIVENKMTERVLSCIGNSDRLNILLAIMKKPSSVAELVYECRLNSTGQAYHHMKPLLAADLITEDENNKGIYVIHSDKVQGIIMMLAGISDIISGTYSNDNWDDN